MKAKRPFWVRVKGFVRLARCVLFHRRYAMRADAGWATIQTNGDYNDMHCLRCNRFWRKPA